MRRGSLFFGMEAAGRTRCGHFVRRVRAGRPDILHDIPTCGAIGEACSCRCPRPCLHRRKPTGRLSVAEGPRPVSRSPLYRRAPPTTRFSVTTLPLILLPRILDCTDGDAGDEDPPQCGQRNTAKSEMTVNLLDLSPDWHELRVRERPRNGFAGFCAGFRPTKNYRLLRKDLPPTPSWRSSPVGRERGGRLWREAGPRSRSVRAAKD